MLACRRRCRPAGRCAAARAPVDDGERRRMKVARSAMRDVDGLVQAVAPPAEHAVPVLHRAGVRARLWCLATGTLITLSASTSGGRPASRRAPRRAGAWCESGAPRGAPPRRPRVRADFQMPERWKHRFGSLQLASVTTTSRAPRRVEHDGARPRRDHLIGVGVRARGARSACDPSRCWASRTTMSSAAVIERRAKRARPPCRRQVVDQRSCGPRSVRTIALIVAMATKAPRRATTDSPWVGSVTAKASSAVVPATALAARSR
jgi:hypothetical protein